MDNQSWALRQHLLYHMLNYTLSPSSLVAGNHTRNITIETTLLFPLAEAPSFPPIPEPGPPWLPRGGEGMLGGHGQRLRIGRGGGEGGGKPGTGGGDWKGEGGVRVWDGKGWEVPGNGTSVQTGNGTSTEKQVKGARWVRNGVVIGLDGVLDMPPSIGESYLCLRGESSLSLAYYPRASADEIIRTHPSLSYLSQLLTEPFPSPLPDSLVTSPHLTVFAPTNDAFGATFDDVERHYLEGGYGAEGVGRVFGGGVVLGIGKEQVGWSDVLGKQGHESEWSLV